ncbi:MAG TPA: ABC transporter substrate-binding protein [Candidatus Bathyarchaeia archaeon]|nr:ABC transporter substrate-binding protein [Candidatus Bathyarchaeia archaeon]
MKTTLAALLLLLLIMLIPTLLWFTPHPNQNSLTLRPYATPDDAIKGLLNGDINLLPLSEVTPEIITQLNSSTMNLIPISNFGFTYIGLNLRNSPLNDTNLREAMLYGFDREKLVNTTLDGYGDTLNGGLFSPAYGKLGWWNNTANSYNYDPDMAKRLLDNAGYNMSSGPYRIDPATGKVMRTMFILSRLSDTADAAAAASFASDMQAIGLPIKNFPLSDFDFDFQVKHTYLFDIYIDTVSADSGPSWLYDLFASSNNIAPVPLGTNLVGYNSTNFDSCVNQLMSTSNQNVIKEQLLECQGILSRDLPALPVYTKYSIMATKLNPSMIVPVTGSLAATLKQTIQTIESTPNFGKLTVGIVGTYGDLDPTSTSSPLDWTLLNLVLEPLLSLSPDGTPTTGLAERWNLSENGQTITFVLRNNLTFSDGEPITIDDLSATINWLMSNVKPSSPFYDILKQIQNITILDTLTLEITLRKPNAFATYSLGQLFALPQNRLEFVSNLADPFGFLRSQTLVSSGPFDLSAFDQGNGADLEINNSYVNATQITPIGTENTIFADRGLNLLNLGNNQIGIGTPAMTYGSQPISNATYAVYIYDQTNNLAIALNGTYIGHGTYSTMLSVDSPALTGGQYKVVGQLFGILPTGMFIIFHRETLIVQTSLPLDTISAVGTILAAILIISQKHREESTEKTRTKKPKTRTTRKQ